MEVNYSITLSREKGYKRMRHVDSSSRSFRVLSIFTKSRFVTEI